MPDRDFSFHDEGLFKLNNPALLRDKAGLFVNKAGLFEQTPIGFFVTDRL